MRICIIGLGFVGLSMATVIASKGLKVIGVDIDKEKCLMIKQRKLPFFEPKLRDLLNTVIEKNLEITSDLNYAIKNSEIIFICVGTPSNQDGSANLDFLKKVSNDIGETLKQISSFPCIVVKSTIPPQTTESVVKDIIEKISSKKSGVDFGLCMNPEFLKEGSAIDDMISPHLIVIGTNDEKSKMIMNNFYDVLYDNSSPPVLNTNIVNSEMIKYANNVFLATKISFINTIANICNGIPGLDVEVIAKALGYDPRIGPLFLKAGPGYGGSCLPKDVLGFLKFSQLMGFKPLLIESTHIVNQNQPSVILTMIENKLKNLENQTIAILGLSFKKNTDDTREAVSIKIIELLLQKKVRLKVHDPMAIENIKRIFNNKLTYCIDILDCIKDTDCCVILTDWDEYGTLKSSDFISYMKHPCVIDTRRVLNPTEMFDLDYVAMGYGNSI